MCNVAEFDPTAAAILWIKDNERRSRPVTKAKQQEWCKAVFSEANKVREQEKLENPVKHCQAASRIKF